MAHNNISIPLPAVGSGAERLAQVMNAFSAAFGCTADENGIFWVNEKRTLGIRMEQVESFEGYVRFTAVFETYTNPCGENYIPSNTDAYFVYYRSAGGSVFQFCYSSTADSLPAGYSVILCEDEAGNPVVFAAQTFLTDKGAYIYDTQRITHKNDCISEFTLMRIPSAVRRTLLKELYVVQFAPPTTEWSATDLIKADGGLYKLLNENADWLFAVKI